MHSKLSFSKILSLSLLVLFASLFLSLQPSAGAESKPSSQAIDQAIDEEYTRLIKEATTKPEFLSPLVSYLPKVEGVPSPKDVLGYITGAPGKLTYY